MKVICLINNLNQNKKMKTIKKSSLVFAIAVASIFSSCSKDDGGSSISVPATGSYINAVADGRDFTTVYAGQNSAIASKSGTGDQTLIQIGGNSISNLSTTGADSSTIFINLYGITTTGTYTVSSSTDGNVIGYTFIPSGQTTGDVYTTGVCEGSTGTITITSFTATQVEGTFSCNAKKAETCDGSKSISQGSFRGVFQ